MSRPGTVSSTVQLACVTVIVCFTISAVVVLSVALPEGGNAGSLIALLLGNLATTLPLLLNLNKTANVERTVEFLANGGGDRKTEAALHRALDQREADAGDSGGVEPDSSDRQA